jgi:hypothetical protein
MGVRSVMNVDASGASFSAQLVNVAPGTLILLCSAILIGLCTTREFTYREFATEGAAVQATPDGKSPPVAREGLFNRHVSLLEDVNSHLSAIQKNVESNSHAAAKSAHLKLKERLYYFPTVLNAEIEARKKAGRVQDEETLYLEALSAFINKVRSLSISETPEDHAKADLLKTLTALAKERETVQSLGDKLPQ